MTWNVPQSYPCSLKIQVEITTTESNVGYILWCTCFPIYVKYSSSNSCLGWLGMLELVMTTDPHYLIVWGHDAWCVETTICAFICPNTIWLTRYYMACIWSGVHWQRVGVWIILSVVLVKLEMRIDLHLNQEYESSWAHTSLIYFGYCIPCRTM